MPYFENHKPMAIVELVVKINGESFWNRIVINDGYGEIAVEEMLKSMAFGAACLIERERGAKRFKPKPRNLEEALAVGLNDIDIHPRQTHSPAYPSLMDLANGTDRPDTTG